MRPVASFAAFYTPPAVGRLLGVSPEKVIGFIRRGELAAVNIAANPVGRPRYRISQAALEAFLARRSVSPAARSLRRPRAPPNVIQFY
ncbi:MAG: helix-turn-helix domain-containing protein [Planctomycetaceae bacterium]